MTMAEVVPYAVGVISASVCAAASLTIAEVEQALNEQQPTGIPSPWTWAEGESFASSEDGDTTQPRSCDRDPNRTHYLFHC